MSQLRTLKSATSLQDLAALLDFKASAIAYILYKKPAETKYRSFEIAKRNGGIRNINAPCDELMLLQRRLCDLLQNCVEEINTAHNRKDQLAHGFKRDRSIVTNATKHKRRRFVFNIDIADFFGAINFGRVRGFFIKNADFALDASVATVIAQISCYENALPQGSPCSPVISNLIGSVLDIRLCKLASECGCTYSRYADDLTFSTNNIDFPSDIAKQPDDQKHRWEAGEKLLDILARAGFTINPSKTRLQYRTSRQEVTGLVVNKKVNIRCEYRRRIRAMVDRLLATGTFEFVKTASSPDGTVVSVSTAGTMDELHGMLGHIWGIDVHNWRIQSGLKTKEAVENATKADRDRLDSKEELYRRFLIYKTMYAAVAPTIICEGKTDNIYLLHAIRSLGASFPSLASVAAAGGKVDVKVRIFKYADTSTGRILRLTGGTGSFRDFILTYSKELQRFKSPGIEHPVILLVDHDDGANAVLGILKKQFKKNIAADEPFIHACGNLYVVTTPLAVGKTSSVIEDCFTEETKAHKIDGKSFKLDKAHGDNDNYYGKYVFAKHIEKRAAQIDFGGFSTLLSRIAAVIEHHEKTLVVSN